MLIFVNGMAESIAKSGSDGFTPLSTEVHAQHGHHSAIIGAQFDLRDAHFDAMLGSDLQQFGAQLAVRGEAAANDQGLRTVLLATLRIAFLTSTVATESASDAHTSSMGFIAFRLLLFDPTRHGRLHAGRTEIVRMLLPALPCVRP